MSFIASKIRALTGAPASATITPLPKRQFSALTWILLVYPISLSLSLPFLVFMVSDFDKTQTKDQVGIHVSYVMGAYSFAQLPSGLIWGSLSDRIGRKPTLIFCLLSHCMCTILFGLSKTLSAAITIRIIAGTLNGVTSIAKSILSEITDPTNEGVGFALFVVAGGLGIALGPLIGGFFSNPVTQFPSAFGDSSFLASYPYFLPGLIGGSLTFTGILVAVMVLKESLKRSKDSSYSAREENNVIPIQSIRKTGQVDDDDDDRERMSIMTQIKMVQKQHVDIESPLSSNSSLASSSQGLIIPFSSRQSRWNTLSVVSVVTPYTLLTLMIAAQEGFFQLWCLKSVEEGGLGFTLQQNGYLMSLLAFFGLAFQVLTFPFCQRRFGTLACCQLSMILMLFATISYRSVSWFPESPNVQWALILIIGTIRAISVTFGFTSSMLLIGAVGKRMGCLGFINGIINCTSGLAGALGPTIGSALWCLAGSGLEDPTAFRSLPFMFIGIIAVLSFLQTLTIRV